MHIVYMITFHPSLMWLAGIFNMLTYTAATSYVADIFLRRVRVRFRVTVYTQLAVGVYWDSTPLTASAEIFKVYISFTLFYMWLHFDIYNDVLCVPAYWSRDGTETQRLDSFWVGSLQEFMYSPSVNALVRFFIKRRTLISRSFH